MANPSRRGRAASPVDRRQNRLPSVEPLEARQLLTAAHVHFAHSTHQLHKPVDFPIVTAIGGVAIVSGPFQSDPNGPVDVYDAGTHAWSTAGPPGGINLTNRP